MSRSVTWLAEVICIKVSSCAAVAKTEVASDNPGGGIRLTSLPPESQYQSPGPVKPSRTFSSRYLCPPCFDHCPTAVLVGVLNFSSPLAMLDTLLQNAVHEWKCRTWISSSRYRPVIGSDKLYLKPVWSMSGQTLLALGGCSGPV